MFTRFDGTGRTPRPLQTEFLTWLSENWNNADVFGGQLPCGVGKSGIAQAISLETKAHTIAVSNALLDQYVDTYSEANYVKGQAHYLCTDTGLNCSETKDLLGQRCEGCKYTTCKKRAESEATIFNPISYWALNETAPKVLVVDEAHRLIDTLMLLCGIKFRKSKYRYPDKIDEVTVTNWMASQVDVLRRLSEKHKASGNTKEASNTLQESKQIAMALRGLRENPNLYAVYEEKTTFRKQTENYLCVMPVELPHFILKPFLECEKLILLSATLLEPLVQKLALGKKYLYKDMPSPIPADSRSVVFDPYPGEGGFKADAVKRAAWIKKQMSRYPGRNTIVHLTYSRVNELREYFPEAFTNTSENKMEVLAKFKAKGGLWLASGCAEGIDLPGDECRLNLIPDIMWANYGDPVVQKRLGLPNGRLQYDLDALTLLIQQAGRSTRDIDDTSTTVIGDSRFLRLVKSKQKYVPLSFMQSIKWRPT